MNNQNFKNHGFRLLLAAAIMTALLCSCARGGEVVPQPEGEAPSAQQEVQPQTSAEKAEISSAESTQNSNPSVGTEAQSGKSEAEGPAPEADSEPVAPPVQVPEEAVADVTEVAVVLEEEAVALAETPAALPVQVSAVASGAKVKENGNAVIDYSNVADGYVMVQYKTQTDKRLKAQVKGPTTTYTYNLTPGSWAVFPLSDGNGDYQVTVYQNVTGSKYAAVISTDMEVTLKDEFAPFLHANQYVNYDAAPNTVAKAAELIGDMNDPLRQVEAVYDFVVKGMTYDAQMAAAVKSGYLPALDSVLAKKSGICFDYAALMTGMLRSQGVPCKLVVGYAGTAYHAWINVWVEGSGWVDGVIWFDGAKWQRMDPTFASSAGSSDAIMAYIGDGANYTAKYFY